jgi:type I restriction enzyme S subunit
MAALSDVADLIMGQSPPSSTYNEGGNGLAFFQGKTDFGFRHPTPKLYCSAPLKIARPNDILMSVRAPVGPANIADRECCIGRGLAAIRPRDIDGNFLYFNLRYLEKFIASLGSGSTFHAISKSQLASLEVNPHEFSLPEQRKIAGVLAVVQRAIEQQERLLALTAELKKALLHQLFTAGLRGENQKQTEIGPVPESWNLIPCEDLCEMITVGVVVKPASHYVEKGVAAFRSFNIREDCLVPNDLVYFSEIANNTTLAKSKLRAGDILIVRTGYPGTSCVVPKEYDGTNCIDLVIARPKIGMIRSGFLSRFFNAPAGKSQAVAAKHGLAQQHLNVSAVKRTLVPVPSLEEQDDIDFALSTVQRKIALINAKKATLGALFRSLLHQLMTAQIRVHDLDSDLLNYGDVSPCAMIRKVK